MTFDEYYRERFRHDLAAILAAATRSHEHPGDPEGATLQPRSLSQENVAIRTLEGEVVVRFATALYFTVLVDEVMYTYYRAHYGTFEDLTRYPKFRGDCPGGCSSHIHPSNVLRAINQRPGSWSHDTPEDLREVIREAIPVMRREVVEFFPVHLSLVDGVDVWRRCCAESPLDELVTPDAP